MRKKEKHVSHVLDLTHEHNGEGIFIFLGGGSDFCETRWGGMDNPLRGSHCSWDWGHNSWCYWGRMLHHVGLERISICLPKYWLMRVTWHNIWYFLILWNKNVGPLCTHKFPHNKTLKSIRCFYHNSRLYSMSPPFSFILPTHSFVCSDWLHVIWLDRSEKAVLSSSGPKQICHFRAMTLDSLASEQRNH